MKLFLTLILFASTQVYASGVVGGGGLGKHTTIETFTLGAFSADESESDDFDALEEYPEEDEFFTTEVPAHTFKKLSDEVVAGRDIMLHGESHYSELFDFVRKQILLRSLADCKKLHLFKEAQSKGASK